MGYTGDRRGTEGEQNGKNVEVEPPKLALLESVGICWNLELPGEEVAKMRRNWDDWDDRSIVKKKCGEFGFVFGSVMVNAQLRNAGTD